MEIVLTVVSIIVLFAGIMNEMEGDLFLETRKTKYGCDDGAGPCADFEHNTFTDWLYFVITTISTVGFGDISPLTPAGRAFTMIFILFTIVVVPMKVNDRSSRRAGRASAPS